ncbi:hypothetical protein Ndes2526B_g09557 [Nannochloris sp. 'desiccata']|nr:hypothetical protein KSW81_000577 [Chlorella desiccata (nom. nud.)]KAH7615698.1 hypothetical protein NADE_007492 [Chlorella desiccata (nom. nud.)]KAH7615712.1 hypothetical protein NADE_007505 [Chlorella desiccata (nom. nud.)]
MRQTLPKLAKNAYEVLSSLPKHGMGTKITRSTWQDSSFWTVTQIKTEMDGKRGKAYGLLTWRGEQQGEQPSRIRGASKKLWRPLGAAAGAVGPEPTPVWPSLAASAMEEAEVKRQEPEATESVEADSQSEDAPPS